MSTADGSILVLVGFRYDEETGDRVLLTKPVPVEMRGSDTIWVDMPEEQSWTQTLVDFRGVSNRFVPVVDVPVDVAYFGIFDSAFPDRLLVRFSRDRLESSKFPSGACIATQEVRGARSTIARIKIQFLNGGDVL